MKVVIELSVRRFRCVNVDCGAVTFAEQVSGLTTPHSRYTPQLRDMLTAIGLALAGRAGVRLAGELGITVSRDVLLRLVRAIPEDAPISVRILGVDDFSFRRGHRYGTILVDLETNKPIDMFDGRDSESLAAWLRQHPEVEVICRDRAGGYAEGAREGAPQAIQVADRFHLWQNLGEAVEKTVNGHRSSLAEPPPEPPALPEPPQVVQPLPEKKIVKRLREHYADVQELRKQKLSQAAIGRKLGMHPATVRKFFHSLSVEDLIAKTEQRAHKVDTYTEYLHRRWNEGERNAAQLFREIVGFGYEGGELAVQRYLRRYREGRGHAPQTGPKPPTVREVTSWIMRNPDRLHADMAATLKQILSRDPELNRLTEHVRSFAVMMAELGGSQLEEWIATVEIDSLPVLASFARNIRRDMKAVHNGLTLAYNSGPVEGNINRVKMLKRQMFGRANLDLLRKRVQFAR